MTTFDAETDFKLVRAAALLDQDAANAGQLAQQILAANPGHLEAGLLLARACVRQQQLEQAVTILAALAEARPEQAMVRWELGRLLAEMGRRADATVMLEAAVGLEPRLAGAWRELSRLYAAAGDAPRCDAAYARYAALVPADAHLGDVVQALALGRKAHAERLLQGRLAASPQDADALYLLATLAGEREDFVRAAELLTECLRIEPGSARARFALASSLHAQQRPALVLPHLDRLLALDPRHREYRALLGSTLTILGDTARAIAIQRELAQEEPGNAFAWLSLGHALRANGDFDAAVAAYRQSVAARSSYGEAWFSLANMKTFRYTPADVAAMRSELQRTDLGDEDRWHLEFALGKAAEDDARYEESFTHYASGNRLRRSYVNYDSAAVAAQLLRSTDVYTPEFLAARQGWGCPAPDPIFVVGLPRSGSTLVEQILASHSSVEGTRELPDVPAFANELGARIAPPGEGCYPDSIRLLTAQQARAYGERYLSQTRPYRVRGAAHFVDKIPNNFVNTGFIHLMLPNARIIDVRRHPMACGFAGFKQLFKLGCWFSYSLEEIGHYYRAYTQLMAHFDRVLPGRVLRVHYERLVADPEAQVRRLLEYCRLPFEESCLRFHENRRVVQTASSEQVRLPIYTEALDHWRHYEPWLVPLRTALGDVVERYPDDL